MSYYSGYKYREYSDYNIKTEAYRHLAIAFILSSITVGLMFLLGVPIVLYYIGTIGELLIIGILFFAALFRSEFSESTATLLLYAFTVCSSITLSFLLWIGLAIDPLIVVGAVGVTSVVVLLAYLFSGQTYARIGQLSKIIVILVILFLIISIFGLFITSADPVFYFLISLFGAIIFSLYMFIDFARLENKAFSSPALMALWIFYDIIYLLKELLVIFLYLFGGNRRD
ncbi:MAG: hypothetical protein EAX86_12410 [Candidatus Heimdallarchaeota archaeon]|nr:hypothetical protein [Candidatus Heimdallarchaeota archaeon]